LRKENTDSSSVFEISAVNGVKFTSKSTREINPEILSTKFR